MAPVLNPIGRFDHRLDPLPNDFHSIVPMPDSRPRPLGRAPRVFVTRRLPESVEARMAELFDLTVNTENAALDVAALTRACAEHDVLVPTVTDHVTADVIGGRGGPLGLLANFGTGYEHIDLDAARAAGVTVTNTPGVLTEDTADLTMALIVAVPGGWCRARGRCGRASGPAGRPPACWASG